MTRRGLLGGGTALLLDGSWQGAREVHALTVTEHEVAVPGLGAEFDGLRVAQLSDLHRGPLVAEKWLRACVARCNALQPDLVLLTGDFVSVSADYIHSCAPILSDLQAPWGRFAVLGNHDHWTGAEVILPALRSAGVEALTNAHTRLGEGLYLAGIDDCWTGEPDPRAALRGIPTDATPLVMTHNPYRAKRWIDRPMTMLCGHTHGGQINLIGSRVIQALRGLGYLSGWFELGRGRLYVNRGLGVVTVPLRIGAPPEITLFTLRAA